MAEDKGSKKGGGYFGGNLKNQQNAVANESFKQKRID